MTTKWSIIREAKGAPAADPIALMRLHDLLEQTEKAREASRYLQSHSLRYRLGAVFCRVVGHRWTRVLDTTDTFHWFVCRSCMAFAPGEAEAGLA